jgi:gamma-glutamylcysteine synthetase
MSEDLEDIKFEKLLAEKRHKELATALKAITTTLNNKTEDNVSLAIETQTVAIKGFAEAIKSLPEPKVNVNMSNDAMEESIKKLGQDILKSLEGVKELLIAYNQPKEWEFNVKRGQYSQMIEKITAKEVIKQSKYQA